MKSTVFVLAMILSVDLALAQTQERDPRRTNGQAPAGRPANRGNLPPENPAPRPGREQSTPNANSNWEALADLLTQDQLRILWPGRAEKREPTLKFKKLANAYQEIGIGANSNEYILAVTKAVILEEPGASSVLILSSIINTFKGFEDARLLEDLKNEKFEILIGIINRYAEFIKPRSVGEPAMTPGESTLREATKYVLKNFFDNDEAKVNAVIAELEEKKALFSLRASVAPRQIGERFRSDGIRTHNSSRSSRGNI